MEAANSVGVELRSRPPTRGVLSRGCGPTAVERALQLRLSRLRERRLQDGSAVFLHRCDCLVRCHLVDDKKEGRGAGLDHLFHLVMELTVVTGLFHLAHERTQACAVCYSDDWADNEKTATQH